MHTLTLHMSDSSRKTPPLGARKPTSRKQSQDERDMNTAHYEGDRSCAPDERFGRLKKHCVGVL